MSVCLNAPDEGGYVVDWFIRIFSETAMRFVGVSGIAVIAYSILFAGVVSAAEPSFCYVGKAPDDATYPNASSPWKYLEYAVQLVALREACNHDTHQDKAKILTSIRNEGCSAKSEMHIRIESHFNTISGGDLAPKSDLGRVTQAINRARSGAQSEFETFCSFMAAFRYPEFNSDRWCELRQKLDPIYRRYGPEHRTVIYDLPIC